MDNCLICKEECNTTISCNPYYHKECFNTWVDHCKEYKCCYCQQYISTVNNTIITNNK